MGSLTVKSFDFLGPAGMSDDAQRLVEGTGCRWATCRNEATIQGPSTTALFPDWGSIHEFTADNVNGCAIFDILTPPYNASMGRDCTYYCQTETPAIWDSTFPGTGEAAPVLLAEI